MKKSESMKPMQHKMRLHHLTPRSSDSPGDHSIGYRDTQELVRRPGRRATGGTLDATSDLYRTARAFQDPNDKPSNLGVQCAQVDKAQTLIRLQRTLGNAYVQKMISQIQIQPAKIKSPRAKISIQRDIASSELPAYGSEEQTRFMRRVYDIQRCRAARRRRFFGDLPSSQLANVEGNIRARRDVAAAARTLLVTARTELEAQQQRRDEQALQVRSIGVASGYRSARRQLSNWRDNFPAYYSETQEERGRLRGGEHGDAAAQLLARHIGGVLANPGYSLHNSGLALDFQTEVRHRRRTRSLGPNRSQRGQWRRSWFYQWLTNNAGNWGFAENPSINEPWHWERTDNAPSSGSSLSETHTSSARTGVAPRYDAPGGPDSVAWLTRAVEKNAVLGSRLGWLNHIYEIVEYFQQLGYLPPLQSPNQEVFATAVMQYQRRHPQLSDDGIIGSNTWRQLQSELPMGNAGGQAASVASQPTSNQGELSGPVWVARFPTSRDLAALRGQFQTNMQNFHQALISGGANVSINATYRPPERAYLMHWAFRIARRNYDPRRVPAMAGVNIRWWHGSRAASRQAAEAMVRAYRIAYRPALNSNHTRGTAVDMNVRWSGVLRIRDANGQTHDITGPPRSGMNRDLWAVGQTFGVIKHQSDRPHWSHNGR